MEKGRAVGSPFDLFGEETVDSFAVVGLACLEEGLRPFRMVDGVGIELGLQGHTAALAVVGALLALFVQEITGVKLDAGAVGGDGHDPAGFRIFQNCAGVAENLKIMVIATLEVQVLFFLIF